MTKKQKKRFITFYPEPEIKELLKSVPKGKISIRLTQLLKKGLEYEREEKEREEQVSELG